MAKESPTCRKRAFWIGIGGPARQRPARQASSLVCCADDTKRPQRNARPSRPMNILFAPDWRAGVPYQTLLADALVRRGAKVQFLQGYKRVLPLSRLLKDWRCDILHLHWPEAYY